MSFLRIATLCAAITSLLDLLASLASYASPIRSRFFFHSSNPLVWISMLAFPLFLLALTCFFTALFLRQKG